MTDIKKKFEKNSCGIETTCAEHKDMSLFFLNVWLSKYPSK